MDTLPRREGRKPLFGLTFLIIAVLCVALLGMVGGVAGFALMANSSSPAIKQVRHVLGLDTSTGVSIPVTQNLRLQESSAVIDAAKKVSPAVVSISASQQVMDFFGQVSSEESGGTGFIITSDGLIVTNKHVVTGGTSYKVITSDGRIFDATVKAVDPVNDLAFIKVDAKDLPVVDLGSSSDLQIGQYVMAIGNALGQYQNSVTLGIVSATNRQVTAGDQGSGTSTEQLSGVIQTDAAINPGNSGGPLVNLAGQVVGINTAIASPSGGSIGIGFAIPIDSVKSAIDSVRKTGEIVHPYLGIRYVPVTKELQQLDNLPIDYGALVTSGSNPGEVAVVPGGPADKAGIQANDIITELNGERIDQNTSLVTLLQKYNVGDQITLTVLRKGATSKINVTLEKLPAS